MKTLLPFVLIFQYSFLCDGQHQQSVTEEFSARIIGGDVAKAGQFSFLAAIYKTTSDGTYFCGGSLIARKWILTAGQCVDGGTLFTIYLGTTNIKTPDSTSIKLATDEYVLHPQFDPMTLENDIGLIKLRMEVILSDYVSAISLAFFELSDNVGKLRAVGWGQTSDDVPGLVDQLHWVELTTISNQDCKMTYGNQITENMVCVVGSYNEGACHGDTGSPLLYHYGGGVFIHQGIASFVSANGCESTDPSGYTRTYPYEDWIRNVTQG